MVKKRRKKYCRRYMFWQTGAFKVNSLPPDFCHSHSTFFCYCCHHVFVVTQMSNVGASRRTSLPCTYLIIPVSSMLTTLCVCVCAVDESHAYTFVNLKKSQSNEAPKIKRVFSGRTEKQQSCTSLTRRLSKSLSKFYQDPKPSKKTLIDGMIDDHRWS